MSDTSECSQIGEQTDELMYADPAAVAVNEFAFKEIISQRNYKAGYIVTKGIIDGSVWDMHDFETIQATNLNGDYIGDSKTAYRLCKLRGIAPETMTTEGGTCCIGYSSKDGKWYGWSHRAMYGFQVGDVVAEGDCTASSGWTDDYLARHPEKDLSLPVGFKAKTIEDAKRMAIAFAESVS